MDSNHDYTNSFKISKLLILQVSRSQESAEKRDIRTAFVHACLRLSGAKSGPSPLLWPGYLLRISTASSDLSNSAIRTAFRRISSAASRVR